MTKICAYELCGVEFEPNTHNQIYHTDECCKLATNARIMRKYYETKSRKKGAVRVCATPGCSTRLSRYNPEKICAKCVAEQKADEKKRMLDILKEVS